jgi:hypothetical protein
MSITKLGGLLVILFAAHALVAQSNPTVGIVLGQPSARFGDIVSADVYVQGATNVGDIDIAMTVDKECLRIVDRQAGSFFPLSEDGAFSPLSELNEHSTRLAIALPDGGEHPSGDGIFYTVRLEVTCARGVAALNITNAKLISFGEPIGGDVSLISYALEDGTLNAMSVRLPIGSDGEVMPMATTGAASQAPAEALGMSLNKRLLVTVLCIVGIMLFGLILLFLLSRRHERAERGL